MNKKKTGLLAGFFAMLVGADATAQLDQSTEESQNQDGAVIEELVVTGSNIRTRRKDFQTPSPVLIWVLYRFRISLKD